MIRIRPTTMQLIRYQSDFQEPMLALHRSAMEGFDLGMSREQEEADLMAVEQNYLAAGGEFLLGIQDDRLIAMAGYKIIAPGVARLRRMRVARDMQGKGHGTKLLKELESRAYAAGIRTICLETMRPRKQAHDFYRRRGYQETGHGHYGVVETVQFRKSLDVKESLRSHE